MSKNTVVDFMREVCTWKLIENSVQIGGPNMTVELDKSLFSKRKSNNGCLLESAGRRRMYLFAKFETETQRLSLIVLEKYIRSGSTI